MLYTFLKNTLKKFKKKRVLHNFQAQCQGCKNLSVSHTTSCNVEKNKSIYIGDNCELFGSQLITQEDGRIEIGNNTTIRYQSIIGSVKKISIGNHVIISNNVHIYDNNNHPTNASERKKMCESGFNGPLWKWIHSKSDEITIEDGVWIGERSTILKGVHIGENAIVGCNSVVTHDVPSNTIVAGNPATVVKMIEWE